MTNQEKMHAAMLYDPNDSDIMTEQTACLEKLYDFNHTRPSEIERRTAMLRDMFAEIGEGCYIEPPFHANWGGKNVHTAKRSAIPHRIHRGSFRIGQEMMLF